MWINGVLVSTNNASNVANTSAATNVYVGGGTSGLVDPTGTFQGQIDFLRVTRNVERYTDTFTPPESVSGLPVINRAAAISGLRSTLARGALGGGASEDSRLLQGVFSPSKIGSVGGPQARLSSISMAGRVGQVVAQQGYYKFRTTAQQGLPPETIDITHPIPFAFTSTDFNLRVRFYVDGTVAYLVRAVGDNVWIESSIPGTPLPNWIAPSMDPPVFSAFQVTSILYIVNNQLAFDSYPVGNNAPLFQLYWEVSILLEKVLSGSVRYTRLAVYFEKLQNPAVAGPEYSAVSSPTVGKYFVTFYVFFPSIV